jgi:hypothetical protein
MYRASLLLLVLGAVSAIYGQALTCAPSAVPATVRSEGITERMGDIVLNCAGGAPNFTVRGNLSLSLSVPITNRVNANNVTDVGLTIDSGNGAQPANVAGTYDPGSHSIIFNGLIFNLSPTGTAVLRFTNVRGAANLAGPGLSPVITAYLSATPPFLVSSARFDVADPLRGLFASQSTQLVCGQNGSPLPDTLTLSNLLATGTAFASMRVTEGIATAVTPISDESNFNGNSGTRIMIRYAGFPGGARLFVPDAIAGSSADQPTAVGDFGIPASGGTLMAPADLCCSSRRRWEPRTSTR